MKGFVKYGDQPHAGIIQHVGQPEPGAHEVLVKVAGCGICGSDLHAYRADAGYEWVRIPVILGHEFTGTIGCERGIFQLPGEKQPPLLNLGQV
jgi:L-iditol 2-dehydrogenase